MLVIRALGEFSITNNEKNTSHLVDSNSDGVSEWEGFANSWQTSYKILLWCKSIGSHEAIISP